MTHEESFLFWSASILRSKGPNLARPIAPNPQHSSTFRLIGPATAESSQPSTFLRFAKGKSSRIPLRRRVLERLLPSLVLPVTEIRWAEKRTTTSTGDPEFDLYDSRGRVRAQYQNHGRDLLLYRGSISPPVLFCSRVAVDLEVR